MQRAVAALAEENGIPVTDLPLDSSLDVKLNVLDQLSGQLDLLLEHFSLTGQTREASEARFLYLNDDVLNNVVNIYTNRVKGLSEADAAERAYYKIRAMSGQMSKACAISNSLRNLKKEDTKNMLLYRLAKDKDIRSEAYEVAGISDVMAEWKGGKADRYARAVTMMNGIKTVQDTEKIKEKLRAYIDRVNNGLKPESGLNNYKERNFTSIVEHLAEKRIEAEERYKRHLVEIEEMHRKRLERNSHKSESEKQIAR